MEGYELASDLVKIGIPSLVALVGTLSSLLLAFLGHRQSILINNLQHDHEREKERNLRTGELIKVCASDLAQLNEKFVDFGTIFFAKIDTLLCDDPWPEAEQELIRSRFEDALLSLSRHAAIKSYLMLLGDKELAQFHQNYLDVVSILIERYSIQGVMPGEELDSLMNQARHWHNQTTERMSQIYLLK